VRSPDDVDLTGMDAALAGIAGAHFARIGADGWGGAGPRRRAREVPMSREAALALDQIAPGFSAVKVG
jgi:hypothetical protein